MKKIMEVEYVGIEDVQEIIDYACAIMQKSEHYINVELSNYRPEKVLVRCYIQLYGFNPESELDNNFLFYMTEDSAEVDVMNECKDTLKKLLKEVEEHEIV